MSAETPDEGPSGAWRLMVEGLVIIGSILVAFGIDAAWEGRNDRVVTGAYLEQLREQMASNRLALQMSRESIERSMLVQLEFRAAISPRPTLLSADSVDALHERSMGFGAASIVGGTLDAVVSRGDISDSLGPESFDRLVRFSSLAASYEKEGEISEEVRERFLDRYMELAPIEYAFGATDPMADFPLDVAVVLSDMLLESRLRNMSIRLGRVARMSQRLEALADSIMADL